MAQPSKRARISASYYQSITQFRNDKSTSSISISRRTRSQAKCFPFLQLPLEARLLIYSMLEFHENGFAIRTRYPRISAPSILLVSRQVFNEAEPIMIKRVHTISIPQSIHIMPIMMNLPLLLRLQAIRIQMIYPMSKVESRVIWPEAKTHAPTFNVIEQAEIWMEAFLTAVQNPGNLKYLEVNHISHRCAAHITRCAPGGFCHVRTVYRDFLKMMEKARGLKVVKIRGDCFRLLGNSQSLAMKAMTRPTAPSLFTMPKHIQARIIGPLVARPDPVKMWKEWENVVWQDLESVLHQQHNKSVKSNKASESESSPVTGKRKRIDVSDHRHRSVLQHESETLGIIMAHFAQAVAGFRSSTDMTDDEIKFQDVGFMRASRWTRDLALQLTDHHWLTFDQPLVPLRNIDIHCGIHFGNETMSNRATYGNPWVRTISPFITDNCLQALRQVEFIYRPSAVRNSWSNGWKDFTSALVDLWQEQHNLGRILLRIDNDTDAIDEQTCQEAFEAFKPLSNLRNIAFVKIEAPFKASELKMLQKMTLKQRKR